MAPDSTSTTQIKNPSYQSLCLYVYLIFAGQQIGRKVIAATITEVLPRTSCLSLHFTSLYIGPFYRLCFGLLIHILRRYWVHNILI
jgi:hypothetical protein